MDIRKYRPRSLQGSLSESEKVEAWHDDTPRTCLKCSNKLPNYLKYYCSGFCMDLARGDGTYGHEGV